MAVNTRFRYYEKMGTQTVGITRSPDNGDALVINIVFKEIIIVKTATDKVLPGLSAAGKQTDVATKTRAGVNVDAGKSTGKVVKPTDPSVPKPIKRSLGVAIANALNI